MGIVTTPVIYIIIKAIWAPFEEVSAKYDKCHVLINVITL